MRRSLEERDAAVNLANAARDQAVQEVESRGHQLGATRAQLEQLQEEHNQILQDSKGKRFRRCKSPSSNPLAMMRRMFGSVPFAERFESIIR